MFIPLLVSTALASYGYPPEIAATLGAPCEPACTICHATMGGGSGTVIQDFGVAMEGRGLTGGTNLTALAAALDAMATDAVDSDGDGIIDVDELTAGTDPNPGGIDMCAGEPAVLPAYGCVNTVPEAQPTWLAVAGAAAAMLIGRRR